jgi:hypothetical protein
MRGGWNFEATFASSTALLIGKLWRGQGIFEQLITPLAFATAAKHHVQLSEVLFELMLERALATTWENWGTPDIRPRIRSGRQSLDIMPHG